jgi:hypothetical protein
MGTFHEQQRRFGISRIPQTNYPTPSDTTSATNFVDVLAVDKNMAKFTPQVTDNKEEATGHEQPTEEYIETWESDRALDVGLSSEQAGRLLLLANGSVVTTQPNAGTAPTVYQHVFNPQDENVSRQLPVTTWIERLGGASPAIDRKFPSMCVEQFGLKGDGVTRIAANLAFVGSGLVTTPSGLSVADMETIRQAALHYFFNTQVDLTIADAGTLSNSIDYGSVKRLESWSADINNNLIKADAYRPGAALFQTSGNPTSGAIRSELLFGIREYKMGFMARLASQSDELAALLARKPLDCKIVMTGAQIGATIYNHSLTLEAPRLVYDVADLGAKNGIVTIAITAKLLFDITSGKQLTWTLINTTTSYTT